MKTFINVLILCFFAWGLIAGINRLYWVNSDDGLAGSIGSSFFKDAGIACDANSVEVKWKPKSGHAVMIYRCSTQGEGIALWPWYKQRESEAAAKFFHKLQ